MRLWWTCLLLVACSSRAEVPEHVAFFTHGMAAPFFDAARAVRLTKMCVVEYAKQCRSDEVDESEFRSLDPGLFETVTVLGTDQAPRDPPSNWEALLFELRISRDDFMRDLLPFEEGLIARLEAVFEMCPEADVKPGRSIPTTIRAVNFGRYWQLDAEAFGQTMARVDSGKTSILADIRRRWPHATCVAAREYGLDVLRALNRKLIPFIKDDWRRHDQNSRFGMGVDCLWAQAILAESVVNPEAMERAGLKPARR